MPQFLTKLASHPLPLRVALFRNILRKMTWISYRTRLEYDALTRPEIGFCIYHAGELAAALGYGKISAIEFGVAGGRGLINIESHVEQIRRELDLEFEVYGFDIGSGLPKPLDYRDMPYLWEEGFYKMDQAKLEARLGLSKLVIGNVKETAGGFFDSYKPAPLGCVMFDLDYYSSTKDAFKVFGADPSNYLPRVYCYFDDVLSTGLRANNRHVGVLRAIDEFNEHNPDKKIVKMEGLQAGRKIPATWNDQIYVFHDFKHPRYCDFVGNPHQAIALN